MRSPTEGKPTFITPKSNRCSKHQVYVPEASDQAVGKAKKRLRSEDDEESPCRSHPWKVRLQCSLEYDHWIRNGRKKSESPSSHWLQNYDVDRHLPARWLKKLLETGSVHDARAPGRPIDFGEDTEDVILDIAMERSKEQMRCSASHIRKTMIKRKLRKIPGVSTIHKLKRKMKFNVTKVAIHPELNSTMMKERLIYAKLYFKADWSRIIVIDEKWFTKEKPGDPVIELPRGMARRTPGVPRHKGANKETKTQYTKVMFLTAVCESGPVTNILLDTTGHTRVSKSGATVSAKVDSNFLKDKWAIIMKAARKVPGLRTGPIFIMLDRASVHRSHITIAALEAAGFTVITQPPRSPDFNLLDAFVFPRMEQWCNRMGAITKDEIKAAVADCYSRITKDMCAAAVRKVKCNMAQSIKLKGGNYYDE